MPNFQEAFETPKSSFIRAFSICMTLLLIYKDEDIDKFLNLH